MEFLITKDFNNKSIRDFFDYYHLSKKYQYKLEQAKSFFVKDEAKLDTLLKTGDKLIVLFENIDKKTHEAVFKDINILYENNHFLLVEKTRDLLVHSDGSNKDNLSSYVEGYFYHREIYARALHRLDLETTGMIMFSKNLLSHSAFEYMFTNRLIKKEYLCLCTGKFNESKGEINKAIGKNRHNNTQVISKTGKEALTKYEVLSYKNGISKVKVEIIGGRRHQIRVHLSSIGHPIVGDDLYGSKKQSDLMLHFYKISFIDPFNKKEFSYQFLPPW